MSGEAFSKHALSCAVAYYLVAMLTFGFLYNESAPLYDRCIAQNPGRIYSCEAWSGAAGEVLFFKSVGWPVYGTGRFMIWVTR